MLVLAVALAIGSGVGGHPVQTPAQRAAQLETQIRCPSCDDLSAAQSDTPAAIAVRHEIATDTANGESNQAIVNAIVAQYGPTILLRPASSGFISLVWFVPVVAGVIGLLIIVWLFVGRAREMGRLRQGGP